MEKQPFLKALDMLSAEVKKYRELENLSGDELNKILQQIVGILFYLETEKTKYHDMWGVIVQRLINEDKSVARAEAEANTSIPELYTLRKITEAGSRVADAIRTNISWLKQEINNSKNQ
jgi:hypothetical protein